MPVIGIDLGGTKLSSAVFSEDGDLLFRKSSAIGDREGGAVSRLVNSEISDLSKRAEAQGLSIESVGICVPGIYFSESGHVWAPNISGWDRFPLRDEVRASVTGDVRVVVDSDRAAYILGETWKGTAQGCRNAVFMAVGTGIGAGILVDGRILRGHGDIAGAVGWMALGRPFREGYARCGYFEYGASGEGLVRMAREKMTANPGYAGELSDLKELSAKNVFDAHTEGDAIAQEVLADAVAWWGMAAANIVSLFNPEKVIFGGGVFGPATRFLGDIVDEARKWSQPISFSQVSFVTSSLGGDAGLFGAGRMAMLAP